MGVDYFTFTVPAAHHLSLTDSSNNEIFNYINNSTTNPGGLWYNGVFTFNGILSGLLVNQANDSSGYYIQSNGGIEMTATGGNILSDGTATYNALSAPNGGVLGGNGFWLSSSVQVITSAAAGLFSGATIANNGYLQFKNTGGTPSSVLNKAADNNVYLDNTTDGGIYIRPKTNYYVIIGNGSSTTAALISDGYMTIGNATYRWPGTAYLTNLNVSGTCSGCGSGMTYPGVGVPYSTGSAWGSSYTIGTGAFNLVQLDGSSRLPGVSAALLTNFPTLNQSTTGNAATATALASTPSGCSSGNAPTGINASGTAQNCTTYLTASSSTSAVPQFLGLLLNQANDSSGYSLQVNGGIEMTNSSDNILSKGTANNAISASAGGITAYTGFSVGSSQVIDSSGNYVNNVKIPSSGSIYVRAFASSTGMSCSGVADGWFGVAGDGYLTACYGGTRYRVAIASF
jgi:hypothetical protein